MNRGTGSAAPGRLRQVQVRGACPADTKHTMCPGNLALPAAGGSGHHAVAFDFFNHGAFMMNPDPMPFDGYT